MEASTPPGLWSWYGKPFNFSTSYLSTIQFQLLHKSQVSASSITTQNRFRPQDSHTVTPGEYARSLQSYADFANITITLPILSDSITAYNENNLFIFFYKAVIKL